VKMLSLKNAVAHCLSPNLKENIRLDELFEIFFSQEIFACRLREFNENFEEFFRQWFGTKAGKLFIAHENATYINSLFREFES
jgi:hypothetical protein